VKSNSQVWMSHGDTIKKIPDNYRLICSTQDVEFAGYEVNGEQTFANSISSRSLSFRIWCTDSQKFCGQYL
jgi:hypothetical protein